jgi:hypothetical protein
MEALRKGFIAPLLLALVALLLVSGGAYFVMHQNPTPQMSQNSPNSSTTQQTRNQKPATPVARTTTSAITPTSPTEFSVLPISGPAPLAVHFSIPVASFSCPDGSLSCVAHAPSYTIDYGDGTDNLHGGAYRNGSDLDHTYSTTGNYTATLTDTTDNKGNGGPYPVIGTVTIKVTGNSQAISVPGMSKYTDADFGFSFWYPGTWTVESTKIIDSYAGGTVQKTLTIAPPSGPSGFNGGNITIDEFNSPTREITTPYDLCSPMSGSFVPSHRYYFDVGARTWMEEIAASTGYSNKDGSPYYTATTTKAANVSHNTMGGLHMFPAGCTGSVIPLSAHNFLVFWYNRSDSPDYYADLAKTIVATDPSVATLVSTDQQQKMVIAVGLQFGALGSPIANGKWHSYNGALYDQFGAIIPNLNPALFRAINLKYKDGKEYPSEFATDGVHVYYYCGRYPFTTCILQNADPSTFTFIKDPAGGWSSFEKDRSHVWYSGTLVSGADPATFEIVLDQKQPDYTAFQKDAVHVWHGYNGKIIKGADPTSFSIVNQALWQSALFETDASQVWYDGLLIPRADPKTFVVDTWETSNWTALMHDANHSYQLLNTLSTISSTTVKIDGGASIPLL